MKNGNIKMIIFAHQAKTAGTVVVRMFRTTYGEQACFNDQDRIHLMSKINLYLWRFGNYRRMRLRSGFKVIHGHFPPGKYYHYFNNAFYMTFYRHPIEQIASHYYYWLRNPHLAKTNYFAYWLHEFKPNLIEFASKIHNPKIIKEYANDFSPDSFDFIGITERFDESIKLLTVSIPELNTDYEPLRVNPGKSSITDSYELSTEETSALNEILKLRIDIYNKALKLFESRLHILN